MANAPNFAVRFEKDSVNIQVNEENKTHNYQFNWSISDDSLHVKRLGSFKIEQINEDSCILKIEVKALFSNEMKVHTETLT